jgi:hypothetical protein
VGGEPMSVLMSYKKTNSWQNMTLSLGVQGGNSLVILGTVELLPYLFLFKLFGFYRHGHIFTLVTSQCLKSVGKTLLAWIAINLLLWLYDLVAGQVHEPFILI